MKFKPFIVILSLLTFIACNNVKTQREISEVCTHVLSVLNIDSGSIKTSDSYDSNFGNRKMITIDIETHIDSNDFYFENPKALLGKLFVNLAYGIEEIGYPDYFDQIEIRATINGKSLNAKYSNENYKAIMNYNSIFWNFLNEPHQYSFNSLRLISGKTMNDSIVQNMSDIMARISQSGDISYNNLIGVELGLKDKNGKSYTHLIYEVIYGNHRTNYYLDISNDTEKIEFLTIDW